ncbi:Stk1 family PASTA domain-containing Ser/Thr kinase [Streptomyces sp. B-S-A8]|uniref:non-specific serine/threonine protein kinase n=1 Tax=Streptomyces solicavernae TaxID=3043614 RepID=A0ABT6RK43_9ACTN|nr:Stk1 family PASTA domain-containing Ser/Thr kinase [Streptomyces sp. B-S-A8]MDI3384797.1 Stk1 family PASTA domain-containing Ser/Thr kinase [Streptomyces sp. B-S-A8]
MEEPRRLGGRYELGQVLGRGGMAEVYLAHDTRLGRTVAVKTLRADLARDPSFQARFRREAQSAASLNHPAIVAVYDTGEDMVYDNGGGAGVSIPYIVMEYVDGSTLRELLHSGRKLLPERAMEMTIGILQALEYSHRAGIVHRDIKPANVMLTRNGQVKVMDFGIARAMGDSGMTMTQTAAVIGTAQYLSPEQAKGEQVDARSDLYSTGCLLYELLTVRPPFVGDSPVAVAYQHVREEAQPPSTYDPEITPEMDAIVLRALVKDPDYRYQSADEMRADIEACLDGQPVAATAALGAVGYGGGHPDDQQTTMLRPQNGGGGQTSMLPPVNPDDGGYGYDDRPPRRGGQRKGTTSTILLILAGLLVLVGAILIGKEVFGGGGNTGDDQVPVPNLVGISLDEAEQRAKNADLKLSVDRKPCEDQEKGNICSQSPESGEVDKFTAIDVVVSTGAPKVAVPNVIGDDIDEARKTLKDFEIKEVPKESTEPEGEVLNQDPSSGTELRKGATVTLTVAKEQEQKTVPDVVGQQVDAATRQLEANGFKVDTQEVPKDNVPAGQVVEQTPKGNTDAVPGSTVTLTVAKAPDQVAVPALTGQKLKDARKALQDAGLTPGNVTGGPDEPNALVVTTDPPAGTQVPANTPVNFTTMPGQGDGGGNGGDDGGGIFGGPSGLSNRKGD